jgi:hypothetical protein
LPLFISDAGLVTGSRASLDSSAMVVPGITPAPRRSTSLARSLGHLAQDRDDGPQELGIKATPQPDHRPADPHLDPRGGGVAADEALDLLASSPATDPTGTTVAVTISLPIGSTVRMRRDQAAINKRLSRIDIARRSRSNSDDVDAH